MTESVYLASAALNLTALDFSGNRAKIVAALEEARADAGDSAAILCLPELCITGPGCEDMFLAPWLCERAQRELQAILPHTKGMLVTLGLPVRAGTQRENQAEPVYKAVAVCADGRILGVHCARTVPNDGGHYDGRWFTAYRGDAGSISLCGETVALGVSSYQYRGITLAVVDDGSEYRGQPVDLILCPAAYVFELGNAATKQAELVELSRRHACAVAFANLLGNESGCSIYDGGLYLASGGKILARSERFSYRDVETIGTRLGHAPNAPPAPEYDGPTDFEEFARVVPLALFDYMRKCRSHGFTLSLSGGADSASIALMVRLMVHFGKRYSEFAKKLEYLSGLESPDTRPETETVAKLLETVYQATHNSSRTTRVAAFEVAKFVGSQHYELDIDAAVNVYTGMMEQCIGRPITWERDDLAKQNIQARSRGPSVWMLANLRGNLLLSTCNRSEEACGYATMDGDTCGSISPIAGIDKWFLRRWLVWMEKEGPKSFGPAPVLRYINEQQPTAELRPSDAHQTDEADLMPYPVLDTFEEALIQKRMSPEEALEFAKQRDFEFLPGVVEPGEKDACLKKWLEKFCDRWNASQWKRMRGAPGFHLDDHDLSPTSCCRFPILSGGIHPE